MENPGRAWRFAIGDLNHYEFLDDAEAAEMLESKPVDLVDAVRAGDDFILAMGNCASCTGPCHLWFMTDSESPAEVCPYLIYFSDFRARKGLKAAVS